MSFKIGISCIFVDYLSVFNSTFFLCLQVQGMNYLDTTALDALLSLSVWCVKDNGSTLYSISFCGIFSACVPNYFE